MSKNKNETPAILKKKKKSYKIEDSWESPGQQGD